MELKDLVVFYGMSFKKNKERYYCNGAFGRYLDKLARKYKNLYLVVPVSDSKSKVNIDDYEIQSSNIIVQELPNYTGYISAVKKNIKIKKMIRKHADKWNSVVYIRHPNPFTKYVYNLAKKKNLAICLHLVGDTKNVVSEGTKYKGLLKHVALLFIEFEDKLIKKLILDIPTLVNGDGLRRLYDKENKRIKEIRTSSFMQKEIVSNVKSLDENLIKLIYVGYLRHEKGLLYLLEAVKILAEEINISLTIVGDGDIINEIKARAVEIGIEQRVVFKGHIPLGEKLFSLYKEHDIFVLPSISEGTPRVLLEAMCNGLPIIATEVGGIPFTVQHGYNGLLVPSKNSKAIAGAVVTLIKDNKLRETIIRNGIEFAKKNTLEEHVKEVHEFIEKNCLMDQKKKHVGNLVEKLKRFFLVSIPVHLVLLFTGLLPNSKPTTQIRGWLLKPFFERSGKNLQIGSGVIINHINNVIVGDNVYIAHNTWVNGTGGIDIEDGVVIGPFSVIVTTEHTFIDGAVSNDETLIAPVKICKGTWLASHVVVTSGVTIGKGCLVAAGAIVTKDVDDYSMVGGVPAKLIKRI